MTVPQNLADEILAKCGRHCCICRRFEPLHLQVHHIVELSEGGADTADNLIAVCLTCHSDVHTRTTLTRRFNAEELKQHRDMTFRLVEEGKLPSGEASGDALDASLSRVLQALGSMVSAESFVLSEADLTSAAIQVLVKAAQSRAGVVLLARASGGLIVQANQEQLCERGSPRSEAEYEDAVDRLVELGLLKATGYENKVFRVTHRGYLVADEILAAGAETE